MELLRHNDRLRLASRKKKVEVAEVFSDYLKHIVKEEILPEIPQRLWESLIYG